MDPANGEPDVLGKIDALLTRHRTGASTQQDLASAETQAARAAIPVLTEIVAEDRTIPVLTEAVPAAGLAATAGKEKPSRHVEVTASEAALHQIEELMVQELENRIALEFTATLDRALVELLDHTREHIRLAVRVALKQRPGTPDEGPDQP